MNRQPARFSRLCALALSACFLALPATAAPLAPSDADKVHQVIAAQLSAFAEDDADRAFDTATPAVRAAIGSSSRFLAMVRGSYPMVYRPAAAQFHKPEQDDGTVLQLVEIVDGSAKSWLVLFSLEQQADTSWRISGCVVAENPWRSI